jgi:uncharacterized protein (DUF952 family)
MQNRRVYHLVPHSVWEAASGPVYSAPSLATEGFIHCSNVDQVAGSANRFYAKQDALVLLEIDVGRLSCPLRDEPSGSGELFPHIYGPIEREAVVQVHTLVRGPDGRWAF